MGLPSLVLGDFDLTDWSGSTYGVSVIAEGTSKGSPLPIEVAVKSWLQDGSVVVTQGYDNRTVTLRVRLRGPDLVAVADAEAALFAELGKPNTLTWTPGDGLSPASVFVVVTSSMDHAPSADEDLAEGLAQPWRTWNIRLLCEAFVRSADEVTVPALAASGTTVTLVDDGSSASGWTGDVNGVATTPNVVSGAVGITTAAINGRVTVGLTRTGTVNTSTTKYLVVDWQDVSGPIVRGDIRVFADGAALPLIGRVPSGAGTRSTFYVAANSVAAFRFEQATGTLTGGGTDSGQTVVRTLRVDNVNRTDIRPSIGTTRQQARTLTLNGSAPTTGSLSISHASAALGDVLLYAWSDINGDAGPYSPALRQFSPSGTADAATVFGSRVSLAAGAFLSIDVPGISVPRGSYEILVRAAAAAGSFTGSLRASTKTRINSTDLDTEQFKPAVSIPLTTAYTVSWVARISLPTVSVRDPSTSSVRIAIQNTSASTVYIDEVWAFNLSIGQFTWVQCGTGTAASGGPSRRVVMDPATVQRPRPVLLRGHATDGSDAFNASIQSWQPLKFPPPLVNLFTVTTNTPDADALFKYWPRWHTNAAS